jgi:nucleotide-binding universal stress UspA family protein
MPVNKVLIPLDGTGFSLQVLPHVKRFLAPEKNRLILVHVAAAPSAVSIGNKMVVFAEQAAASLEASFRASILPYVHSLEQDGYRVKTAVLFGDPATQIERFIDKEQVDLVVMVTHGRTGLSRVLIGSVAQHVLNHVAVPVLLVRSCVQETKAVEPLGQMAGS